MWWFILRVYHFFLQKWMTNICLHSEQITLEMKCWNSTSDMQVHDSVNQVCPHFLSLLSDAASLNLNGSALIHSKWMKMKMFPFVSVAAAWGSAVTADHLCRWAVITVCLRSPRSLELASTARGRLFRIELQSKACLTLAVITNLKNKKSTQKKNLVLKSKSC